MMFEKIFKNAVNHSIPKEEDFSEREKRQIISKIREGKITRKSRLLPQTLSWITLCSLLCGIILFTVIQLVDKNQDGSIDEQALTSEIANETNENTSVIEHEDIQLYEDAFLAENFEVDLDGDGSNEVMKMYIYPAPIEMDGQYFWDDSHLWQLIVFDGDRSYPLFNNHVSGILKFWIEDDGERPTIVLMENGIGMTLQTFRYHDNGYYSKNIHYQIDTLLFRSTTIQ